MKKKMLFSLIAAVLALAMTAGLCGCKSETVPQILEPSFDPEGRPIINLWAEGSQEEMALGKLIQSYNALPDRKATAQLQFIRSGAFDAGIASRYAEAYAAGEYRGFDIIAGEGSAFGKIIAACGNDGNAFCSVEPSRLPNMDTLRMVPQACSDRLIPCYGNWVVFAYDSAKVPQPPQTWEELTAWIAGNPGRFTYCDPNFGSAGNAFVTVGIHQLTGDPSAFSDPADPKWAEAADAGFDWLKTIHPSLYASGGRIQYPTKDMSTLELLSSGEVWLAPVWADDVLRGMDQKTLPDTIKMYQMADRLLPGTDHDLAICATTASTDGCYDFINYAISAQGQQLLAQELNAIPAADPASLGLTALAGLDPAHIHTMDAGDNENKYRSRWTDEIATIG